MNTMANKSIVYDADVDKGVICHRHGLTLARASNMEGDQEKIGEGEVHGGAVSVVEENVSINEEEIMGGLTDNEK